MKMQGSGALTWSIAVHWVNKLWGFLGRAGSLGISNVGQTVLSRSIESRIWHQLASSVEGGFRKGTMASADLDARHFSFSLCATGVIQAATLVLELRGSESE